MLSCGYITIVVVVGLFNFLHPVDDDAFKLRDLPIHRLTILPHESQFILTPRDSILGDTRFASVSVCCVYISLSRDKRLRLSVRRYHTKGVESEILSMITANWMTALVDFKRSESGFELSRTIVVCLWFIIK